MLSIVVFRTYFYQRFQLSLLGFYVLIVTVFIFIPQTSWAAPAVTNTETCPVGTTAQCTCKPGVGQKEQISTACGHGLCCRNLCGGVDQVKKFECAQPILDSRTIRPIAPPNPAIYIPGFTGFTTDLKLDKTESFYQVPWIAEYISTIYKFGVGVAVVLAIVMIVFGGFVWMTAGGNAQQVTTAKGYILGAIGGVALALGSYSILYLVNPNLTKLSSVTVPYIKNVPLEMATYDDKSLPSQAGSGKPLSATDYDVDFKRITACIGLDWRVAKAIASKESGLNAEVVNSSGYTGLLQVGPKYCPEMLQKMGMDKSYCTTPGLKNPAVNIAAASGQFIVLLQYISQSCSSSPVKNKAFMLYFGHSSGPGALKYAIERYGCDTTQWTGKYQQEADKNIIPVKYFFKGAPAAYVEATAQLIINQGITSLQSSGACDKSIKTGA